MISKSHTKYIQSLQHKKFRDESNRFIGEGPKLVTDLLEDGNFRCEEIYALPKWLNDHAYLQQKHAGTRFEEVKDFELEKISALITPHQVLAVFEKQEVPSEMDPKGCITLALDAIQDPGNLGTLIRIADWFGVKQIMCSPGCADQYNPKVVQASMGSIGRVRLKYDSLAEWLGNHPDIPSYAAALQGNDIRTIKAPEEAVIIIGNEAHGISAEVMAAVKETITIKRKGKAESLNAAVAAGIILSHLT